MVRARLAERGRAIVAGEPPLTEMAAAAFCELYAYSRLLRRDGSALPDQLGDEAVAGGARRAAARLARLQRRRARARWPRRRGCGWCCARWWSHGDAAQREAARRRLLSRHRRRSPAGAGPGRPGGKGDDAVGAMLKHNVLMNIRQQTFNSYMWSRGFNYQPASGKMW